jgi:anti-sigma regulatory factor (Ser/Thr protein kinase)
LTSTAAGQDPTIADTLQLALAPTVTAPDRARAEVAAWLARTGRGGTLIDDVRLLVSELVTNCVRHASLTKDQPVKLTATLHAAILRLEVHDQGRLGTVARRPPGSLAESGFGLNLVARLADDWGVDRDSRGTTVWLELAAGA